MSVRTIEEAIATSPYAWWQWTVSTNTVEFSERKATMLGYHPERFMGRGYQAFTEIVHPDDFEKAMEAMRALLTGALPLYQTDYRILDSRGEYHWYMDRGVAMTRTGAGKPEVVRGIVIDLGRESLFTGTPGTAEAIVRQSLIISSKGVESTLTLCSSCQRTKVGAKHFTEISQELYHLLSGEISHGLCPDCFRKLYPDYTHLLDR